MSGQGQQPAMSPELIELVNGYCDGTLSESAGERLESLLHGNRHAQRIFLVYLSIHARMCWDASAAASGAEVSTVARQSRPAGADAAFAEQRRWAKWMALAASLAAVLAALAFWQFSNGPNFIAQPPGDESPPFGQLSPFATVTQASGRWTEHARQVRAGETFAASVVDLAQGFVELTFRNGAVVLLEAPTRLEIIDANRTYLHFGRLVARVEDKSVGFVVETRGANLIDLGTEFGATVDMNGVTQVQVFDGAIEAAVKDRAGKSQHVERLVAGEAREIASTSDLDHLPLQSVAFRPESFVRTFPVAPSRKGPDTPYNRSLYDTIHVAAAAKRPTIDGDLADWNQGQGFTSYCVEPYGESYHATGMMAYDAERLYIAAHVADPAPLRNQVDPQTDPAFYWAGGSVLVRLAANRNFGWPLDAVAHSIPSPGIRKAGERPQDLSEQIVHLGMWYSQPQAAPQLRIDYGIGCRRHVLNPEGWEGAFRKDADGRGYTLEYSIPWSLLNAEAPAVGDLWPAMWNVHWSDQNGRTCMGQMAEITNPDEERSLFLRGSSWGKAIFDAPQ